MSHPNPASSSIALRLKAVARQISTSQICAYLGFFNTLIPKIHFWKLENGENELFFNALPFDIGPVEQLALLDSSNIKGKGIKKTLIFAVFKLPKVNFRDQRIFGINDAKSWQDDYSVAAGSLQ